MNDPQKTVVSVSRKFSAASDKVFDAWLDPESARQWLFATPSGEMVRAEIDARAGGSFILTERRNGEDIEHRGEYLEINRPKRLAFTFRVSKFEKAVTKVTIDIKPLGNGCELTLNHEGVFPDYAVRTKEGWTKIFDQLAVTLGEP